MAKEETKTEEKKAKEETKTEEKAPEGKIARVVYDNNGNHIVEYIG